MKSGFSHFDSSDRETFIAAVLLLAMEVDDAVKDRISGLVRRALDIDAANPLLGFGREARLAKTDDDSFARVDLWLLFGSESGPFYAFVEVKTHNRWDAAHVAHQVRDQAERTTVRRPRQVRGSVLLAPERLCRRVREVDSAVRWITWLQVVAELRGLSSTSPLTTRAIRHLEENMERPASLDRPLTLDQFEQATTTVACLRQFLRDCIFDLGGSIHGDPLLMTPGDGQPHWGSGWAWHGLSVPFTLDGKRGRVGIYKYAEAPQGEESALSTLWLEAYVGEGDIPLAAIQFAPATLATTELERQRAALIDDARLRARPERRR